MKKNIWMWIAAMVLLVLISPIAHAQFGLGDLYSNKILRHWQGRYPQNIQWNFDNLVLGKLTPRERRRVGNVKLDFPLHARAELRNHPLQFYAQSNTITVPILSVRFFDDITQVWGYLWSNNDNMELVGDYLAMLKYRDPADFPGGRFPAPLEALNISRDAWKHDPKMDDVSQKALKSAIVWILAHELAHIYYRHPGYGPGVTRQQAQANEAEADRFANMIMRRIGVAPIGVLQFFMAMSHLEPGRGDFANDAAWQRYLQKKATHPLTARRLTAMAADLRRSPHDFTAEERDQQAGVRRIYYIADQIEGIGTILENPDMHRLVVAIGLSTDLQSLRRRHRALEPVAPGRLCGSAGDPTSFSGRYTGLYTRHLRNGQSEWLSARMDLKRNRNRIVGRFSFGLGEGVLEGFLMQGRRLVYDWRWGNAAGRGFLEASSSGGLTGSWGYNDATQGGGTWDICTAGTQ
jgi:hypothetical protein